MIARLKAGLGRALDLILWFFYGYIGTIVLAALMALIVAGTVCLGWLEGARPGLGPAHLFRVARESQGISVTAGPLLMPLAVAVGLIAAVIRQQRQHASVGRM